MKCPDCGQANIDGIAACEGCGQDLTSYDSPASQSDFEAHILELPLERLRPREAVVVPPEMTVAEAAARLSERRIGCVLVGTHDDVVGIFSERDLLLRVSPRFAEAASMPVSEFMTPDPEKLSADTPIAFALNRMAVGDFRHVPVTRDGRLAGVVSLRDILGLLSEHCPDLIPAPA